MFSVTNFELNLQGQVGAGGGGGGSVSVVREASTRGQIHWWPPGGTPKPGNLVGRWV